MAKHLFGPVLSRRLGISLGIDLIPYKTCTFDCVYCECGKTTNKTCKRQTFIPTKTIINELQETLKEQPKLDHITFAGSGEPTLALNLGEIINYIKQTWPHYKIAVLTNSSLLSNKKVQSDLLQADLLIPSIEAISNDIFQKLNKPHKAILIQDILNGILEFAINYKNKLWLEVFILQDYNENSPEITKLKEFFLKLNPEKIQLNTLDRPGTENNLAPVSFKTLTKIQQILKPLNTEIITTKQNARKNDINAHLDQDIIATIQRRPSTAEDLIKTTNGSSKTIQKLLLDLEKKNQIVSKKEARGIFYFYNYEK
jgi:wyosine [tRNA(Phe)-imidazoG37] synthetase (radical SAM superfamily)